MFLLKCIYLTLLFIAGLGFIFNSWRSSTKESYKWRSFNFNRNENSTLYWMGILINFFIGIALLVVVFFSFWK